ncbi:phosphatidyl inositol kinase, partial [Nowakowskiella sp. JEL0407]
MFPWTTKRGYSLLSGHEDDIEFSFNSLPPASESVDIPSLSALQHLSPPSAPPNDSLCPLPANFTNPLPPVTPLSDDDFIALIKEAKLAISLNILPKRIQKGSSGSYFIYNRNHSPIGVFKPKNEEPYGHLNPKWVKFIHRTFLPCCFGRSCIIPNVGYVSEAAASFVDRRLQLNIVPRTEIVKLSSPSFFYGRRDRFNYEVLGIPLPEKIGSFQVFLHGYQDATSFFKDGFDRVLNYDVQVKKENGIVDNVVKSTASLASLKEWDSENWSEMTKKQFQWGFERLVILDYLIRNTDRGSDNWM